MGMTSGAAYSQIRTLRKIADGITDLITFKESAGKNYKRDLDRLIKKGFITLGGEEIKLSPSGIKLLKESAHKNIEINPSDIWDRNWHIVAYDIPEELRQTRN